MVDPFFGCHIGILDQLQQRLPAMVENKVLDILPDGGPECTLTLEDQDDIMGKLLALQRAPYVTRSSKILNDSVSGAIIIVKKILRVEPPQNKEISAYSVFHRRVLERCGYFARVDVPCVGAKGARKFKTPFGKEAMSHLFKELNARLSKDKDFVPDNIENIVSSIGC